MDKDKLILNDQSGIGIESASSLSDIKVLSETKDDMVSKWDMLTDENLKFVRIQNSDGVTVGTYKDLILHSETSIVQKDGTVLTRFSLREKTEIELLQEEVAVLKDGQEMITGAIDDLGSITSALAEAQEGGA